MQNFHLSRYQKGDKRKSKKRDFQHTTQKKKKKLAEEMKDVYSPVRQYKRAESQ